MRSLFLIRHAKSSWDDASQTDFDRPLNSRGHRDAPEMAKRLHEKRENIDLFISSPAKRTLTTCEYFAKTFGKKNKDIIKAPQLYEANPPAFFDVIAQLNDLFDSVAIFSHNPAITDFVNSLTEIRIDNMSTCAIFAVQAKTQKWKEFKDAKKTFLFLDYPGMA